MVAALRMPHSGLIHALCCAEARSRVSLSSSSGHQKDRIKKYILSQQEAKLVNIAMTSSPHRAEVSLSTRFIHCCQKNMQKDGWGRVS